jgi:CO/xanthine dehydrogenase Mo-binding subunit
VAISSVIGDAPKRREDLRFVTGSGRYLDDLAFERLTHAVVLRSPHAHARIERILTERPRAAPGVLTVLTAEDVRADGLKPLRPSAEANVQTGEQFAFAPPGSMRIRLATPTARPLRRSMMAWTRGSSTRHARSSQTR